MRAAPLLACLVLLTPPPVRAQGYLNLSWNGCQASGMSNRLFACDANGETRSLVASFVTPQTVAEVTEIQGVIDLCSMPQPLPEWWHMEAGGCREGALGLSFGTSGGCADPWNGRGTGVFEYVAGYAGEADRVRITVFANANDGQPISLAAGVEYVAFRLDMADANTVGTGACTGCDVGVCIVLNNVRLVTAAGPIDLQDSVRGNSVAWQGGVVGCPFIVPVRAASWGAVKILYR